MFCIIVVIFEILKFTLFVKISMLVFALVATLFQIQGKRKIMIHRFGILTSYIFEFSLRKLYVFCNARVIHGKRDSELRTIAVGHKKLGEFENEI